MGNDSDNSMNVYPQINFMKYFGQIVRKHKWIVLFTSLLFGSILLAAAYVQIYSSSTLLRFRNSTNSYVPSFTLPFEGMEKPESMRDKNFTYLQSMPFYMQLSRELAEHPQGKEYIHIFQKSKQKKILKLKRIFYDSPPAAHKQYENPIALVAAGLKRVITFKKDHENGLVMYLRSGTPELSIRLGKILSELTKNIIIRNETYDLKISSEHLKELIRESQDNLMKLNEEILQHVENQIKFHGTEKELQAMMETEKELRLAKIEVQRLDLLMKGLQRQIDNNSTFSIGDSEYNYVDRVSIERLEELKRERESAAAKVKSVSTIYEKLKQKNLNIPGSEQIQTNLNWSMDLEKSINKDLLLRSRDIEGLLKSSENVVRLIGDTTLVPDTERISKPLKFILGLFIGLVLSLFGIYYFYDFFKVVRGQKDLWSRADKKVLNSIPRLKKYSKKLDIWKQLPPHHHVLESFRFLMEFCLEKNVVTFLSSGKGEGKSFIISNLALNLDRFGKRVLIVDLNFENQGLSKVFSGHSSIKVISAKTFRHDKESILDRSLLIKEIRSHSKDCDVVLIDTQNLGQCNDGLIASSVSNTSIVVASYLETYYHKLDGILQKLKVSEIENFYFLLNKANINEEIIKGHPRALDMIEASDVVLRKIG